jgi:hypothetical protein
MEAISFLVDKITGIAVASRETQRFVMLVGNYLGKNAGNRQWKREGRLKRFARLRKLSDASGDD